MIMVETWRDLFRQQVGSGKFWKNLCGTQFDNHLFLDRPDVVCIIKQAQRDGLDELLAKLWEEGSKDTYYKVAAQIELLKAELTDLDDSAIGMYHNGKQL